MKHYQQQALQTLSETSSRYEGIQHAGFGLMTEIGEILDTYKRHRFYKLPLDKKNLIEEVGDVLWYIAVGYHFLNQEMPKPTELEYKNPNRKLDFILGKMVTHAARFFGVPMLYAEDWTEEFIDYDLDKLYTWLNVFIIDELGSTLEECAQANLTKLAKRYPGKTFSMEATLNRDTTNELSHIEV